MLILVRKYEYDWNLSINKVVDDLIREYKTIKMPYVTQFVYFQSAESKLNSLDLVLYKQIESKFHQAKYSLNKFKH